MEFYCWLASKQQFSYWVFFPPQAVAEDREMRKIIAAPYLFNNCYLD